MNLPRAYSWGFTPNKLRLPKHSLGTPQSRELTLEGLLAQLNLF